MRLVRLILSPIIGELPFFLFYLLLIGARPLRGIHSQFVDPSAEMTMLNQACQLAIVVLMGYLLTTIVHLAANKWVKGIFYAVIVLFFSIDLFLDMNFGIGIKPYVLMLIAETNGREAHEFADMFCLSKGSITTYVIAAAAVAAIVICERLYHRKERKLLHVNAWNTALATAIFLTLVFGAYSCSAFARMLACESTDHYYRQQSEDPITPNDPVSCFLQSCYGIHLASHEMHHAIATTESIPTSISTHETDSLDLIFVIGESFSKWHSSLYGYAHDTNPHLRQEAEAGRLFVFTDAVSPFSLTSPAMKHLLCCNSIADGEDWYDEPYLPALFKSARYGVYLWDNQKDVNPSAGFSFALNSFLYNPQILSKTYTQTNSRSFPYDFTLVNDYIKQAHPSASHNFIIFHLIGQHFESSERYPHASQFCHFTADSIVRNEPYITLEKRRQIAEYDNATLYNDHVLNRIIEHWRHRNAVIVYLSDHGEEVYDYKDAIGRRYAGMTPEWLKYIHAIPFVVWCSDQYMSTHPETIKELSAATGRPFTTDNTCQLLLHLGGLETSYYHSDRDLLSPDFKPRRRIVEGKEDFVRVDYDSIMPPPPLSISRN